MQTTPGASAPNLIKTFTGRKIDLWTISASDIDIEDIARSQAMQVRFGGHLSRFYSVAEHATYCAMLAPKVYGVYFQMHDALETYMQDVTKPNKDVLAKMFENTIADVLKKCNIAMTADSFAKFVPTINNQYEDLSNRVDQAIMEALGLSYATYRSLKKEIKEVDIHVFNLEVKILRNGLDPRMVIPPDSTLRGQPFGMPWEEAEIFFMNYYNHLTQ